MEGAGRMLTFRYAAALQYRSTAFSSGPMPCVASRREVAELEVSASTTIVWVKCFRAPGETISPLEKHASFLLGLTE